MSDKDLPVVILTYGDQSCLVNVPKKYEDITALVIEVFSIDTSPTNVVLTTSTLDICQGREVKIYKDAWESVFNLVAEVQVSISVKIGDARGRKISGALAILPSRAQAPENQTAQNSLGNGSIIDYEDEDEAEQLAALSSFAGSVTHSELSYDDDSETEHPVAENQDEVDIQDAPGGHERNLTAGRTSPSQSGEPNPMDEDLVEYNQAPGAYPLEAKPGRFQQLARVLDAYEGDLQDVTDGAGSQADTQGADRPIKEEDISVRRSPGPRVEDIGSSQPQTQSQKGDHASKFIISVEHRPSEQKTMFKTRGEHTVGKVLSKVCKTFNLDYDRAMLKLIVEVEGEELLYDCDTAVTMARAGTTNEARFVIIIAEDDEDDELDD
jgi:hypothetical protein